MNNKISLIINTISKNSDIWSLFFDKLDEYTTKDFFHKKYIFVDDDLSKIPDDFIVIKYDSSKNYKEQFCSCIDKVEEEYCIYISEDYILYDFIDESKINQFKSVLNEDTSLSFVRFMRGGVYDGPFESHSENLFYLPIDQDYFYTNQAALWRTRDLELIHLKGPNLHIANKDWKNSFEYRATQTCRNLDMKGLFCYYDESKSGLYHYNSSVFPHISTALVKGKWNLTGYPKKMPDMIKQYNIDISQRGWV